MAFHLSGSQLFNCFKKEQHKPGALQLPPVAWNSGIPIRLCDSLYKDLICSNILFTFVSLAFSAMPAHSRCLIKVSDTKLAHTSFIKWANTVTSFTQLATRERSAHKIFSIESKFIFIQQRGVVSYIESVPGLGRGVAICEQFPAHRDKTSSWGH